MTERHLDPTDAAAVAMMQRGIDGPLVMLNLLRLRPVADYSGFPELAPAEPISGEDAYRRYIDHTRPFLEATGGSVLLLGTGGPWFIGPPDERWDLAMLVRQNSIQDFIAFASDPDCMRGIGHRAAAVEDSRLLPLEPRDLGA